MPGYLAASFLAASLRRGAVSIIIWATALTPALPAPWKIDGKPVSAAVQAKLEQYQAGYKLFKDGRIKEAEAQMKVILEVKPEMPVLEQDYAFVLMRLGRNEEAIKILEHAIGLKPDLASAWGNLAGAYGTVGRGRDAIKAYKEYMRLYPENPQIDAVRSLVQMMEREAARSANMPRESANDYFAEAVETEGLRRWPSAMQPLKVCLIAGEKIPGYKATFLDAAKGAFLDWEAASGGKIRFAFVNNPEIANIKCTWSDNPLMSQAEGGHAAVYNQGDRITSAEIILRTLTPMPDVNVSDVLMHRFALHEIGHALGLVGHSRNPKDALYSGLALSEEPMKLSARDANTIKRLYDANVEGSDKASVAVQPSAVQPGTVQPATVLHNFSDATAKARAAGDLDLAEKFALLQIEEARKFGKEDIRFAKSLIDLGCVYLDRSKFHDAEMSFGIAQKIYLASAASHQDELASTYKNLGLVYFKTGRQAQAEASLCKSIEIREKSGGANSEELALTLKNYAQILRAQKRITEAQGIEEKAAFIEKKLNAVPN